MRIPVDSLFNAAKLARSVQGDADAPVRVGVYIDSTASEEIVLSLRDALVPQTTAGLVRVDRLGDAPLAVKDDTDVAIVVSSGSERLQARVQEIVVTGVPVVVLAESCVEVPFIRHDTNMLGCIAATDRVHLLDTLARWILDRTEKQTAFAANFSFMRIAAAMRIVSQASVGNLMTGALFFVPGADFPVMTLAQLGMMLQLSAVFGKQLRPERAYEAAAVIGCAFALRGAARLVSHQVGRLGFVPRALIAGAGTYAIGRGLMALYERDVDYANLNAFVRRTVSRVKDIAHPSSDEGAVGAPVVLSR